MGIELEQLQTTRWNDKQWTELGQDNRLTATIAFAEGGSLPYVDKSAKVPERGS